MALTKDQKHSIVADVANLLDQSKMTVVAAYTGTPVKAMQQLRRDAQEGGTQIRVVKNRLVIKALRQNDRFKNVDTDNLIGQLLYAFNSQDEAAPAQALANFAKTNDSLAFVGAITADGNLLSVEDVKMLANLPTKDQLRGQLVGTIGAPLSSFVRVLSGNLQGVLFALNARAESIN
jgi:large subunit ribosomal protein L10